MVEVRAREHESVDDGRGDARLDTGVQRPQHVVGGRAVEDELVADARVNRRDDPWTAVDRKADVTDECLVEYPVDQIELVLSALGEAADTRAVGRRELHRATLGRVSPGGERFSCASMSRMDRVRMGIIGVGNIATLNVPGYLEHEQCDVI